MIESSAHEACSECGVTRQERLLGIQMAEMLAGASERAKREAKRDDPVETLRRMAAEFGYELVPVPSRCSALTPSHAPCGREAHHPGNHLGFNRDTDRMEVWP